MGKLSAKQFKQLILDNQCEEAVAQLLARLEGVAPAERQQVCQRLGVLIEEVFDDFAFGQISRFMAFTRQKVGQDVAQVFEDALETRHELTRAWHQKLLSLEPERHARGLRESLRARELDAALAHLTQLLEGHTREANFTQRLKYAGAVLGSLANDQATVSRFLTLARRHARGGVFDDSHLDTIAESCQARMNLLAREASINREMEFRAALTRLTVELRQLLPSAQTFESVPAAEVQRFQSHLRAIVRTAFLPNHPIAWTDLCELFVEFVPAEVSAAGARGGVEGRLSKYLNPAQQMTANYVFGETGKIATVREALLKYATRVENPRELARAAEVMGLLGHPAFADFLQERVGQRKFQSVRNTLVEALGRLGSPDSAGALIEEIRRHIHGATREGPDRRRVLNALKSLGEFIRSSRIDTDAIRSTISDALALAPPQDDRLALEFALGLMPRNADSALSPTQRSWFINALTRGLWLGENTPEFAGGDDRQRTVLGWRQPIVEAIEGFGEEGLIEMVLAAEPLAMRYSGAYLALAEIASDAGGEAMLPLLDTCLRAAILHSESSYSRYARETFYDSTDGQRKPITKRMMMAALVYGVSRIGGPRADAILLDLYNRIRSGEVEHPGDEAAKILFNIHLKSGGGDKQPPQPGPAAHPPAGAAPAPAAGRPAAVTPLPQTGDAAPAAVAGGVAAQIKTLKKTFLFSKSKKRAAKIPAIQALGAAQAVEAIEPLLDLLGDDDNYIQAAAINALKEFAGPKADSATANTLVNHCVARLESAKSAVRNRIVELMIQLRPARSPALRQALQRELGLSEPGSKLQRALRRILEESAVVEGPGEARPKTGAPDIEFYDEDRIGLLETAQPVASLDSVIAAAPAGAPAVRGSETPRAAKSGAMVDKVALRRQYLEERRAWLAGGKKGKEPARPPGV